MKNKLLYASLVCLLLLCPVLGMAADEKKLDVGGVVYLAGENVPIPDVRGKLIILGLTPRDTSDFTFADDVLISGDLTVTGTITGSSSQDFSDDLTLENDEILSNGTDAVFSVIFNDDATEVGDFQIKTSNTAGGDGDYFRVSYWFEDDGSVATEAAYLDVSMDDETSNTFDSTMEWAVTTNDTLAAELNLNGAALYPETDAGLDLGTSSLEFAAGYFDGILTIDGLRVDDALADIGGGTYSRADADNDLGVAGDFEVVGIAEFDSEVVMTKKAVSLTSPTTTVDVSGAVWIELNSDANQTGLTLTNAVIGVEYLISMGSGSNTVRFDDDGVNMALGGNITLTEGEGDTISFCV